MSITVPTRHNRTLRDVVARINDNAELLQLYACANMNAVSRSHLNDHGEVHIRIVANAALRLLRLLAEAGITPNIVSDYGLTVDDAEVVVVLASCLHDVGISIHRDNHEHHSLVIAYPKARELLSTVYEEPARTIVVSEVLHAIIAHNWSESCLTLEAGVVKVADALDMTQGRSRIPYEAGSVNIHSVSAKAIREVRIEHGEARPVRIAIDLNSSAGIFQVDELLQRKLRNSTLAPHVEVVAQTLEGIEDSLSKVYLF
jgi:metal-dependent HD superfamily phosphatase/phosphodiesterase